MRKLRLELPNLQVQSFETTDAPADSRGTVHGHTNPRPCFTGTQCISYGEPDCDTVFNQTCGEAEPSCAPSCDPHAPCCPTGGAISC